MALCYQIKPPKCTQKRANTIWAADLLQSWMYRIKPYRIIWEVVAFVKYSLFLHCCSALRKHLIPCINAAQVPLIDKEACLVCIRGWSKGVHVYACPVFVYAKHRRGKQMQAVAGLRVKLQPNTILSMVTLPASLCLFSPLSFCSALFFFFPPSIPLGNSSLIKKMGLTPNKPFCLSVWP